MLLTISKTNQQNLFYSSLSDMLDMNNSLIALANVIDWKIFENEFAIFYSKDGSPAKPIRLMVGLLILKQLENLSDESIVIQWKRNPYYQYFCGYNEMQLCEPCHILMQVIIVISIFLILLTVIIYNSTFAHKPKLFFSVNPEHVNNLF